MDHPARAGLSSSPASARVAARVTSPYRPSSRERHWRSRRYRSCPANASRSRCPRKRSVEVQLNRRTELVQGFAFQADEDRDGVALLFDSDALSPDVGEAAPEAKLHIFDVRASLRTLCQVDHARAVLACHGFLGIVIEILANDQDRLAVAIALRVRERDVGRQGNVPGNLLPEIAELVARVPDVVAGRVDGVLIRAGV